MTKTNAMRMLDKAKIPYEALEYKVDDDDLSGVTIAKSVGLDCCMVFKTLVAKGDKTGPIVMCIPADKEIDLKKAEEKIGSADIKIPVEEKRYLITDMPTSKLKESFALATLE